MLAKPLVISGSFTVEPLEKFLLFIANILQRPLEIRFAPYNQIFQELLDPNSLSSNNREGINFFLYRFEDLFHHEVSIEEQVKKINQHGSELIEALRSFSGRNCPPTFILRCFSSPETRNNEAVQTAIVQAEKLIKQSLSGLTNIHYLSQTELEMLYPVADYYDSYLEHEGHIPYTKEEYCALALYMMRKWHVLHIKPYKVIALDADNTLWKGVCGERGPTSVEVTSPYKTLQEFMLKQMQEGLLLCLCSKNTENDVWDVFTFNSGMVLKQENFVGWRINWEPKSANLIDLANELKLDPNSFIFLDDNPVETAEVQASCPTIMAVTLPSNEEIIPSFLKHLWIFDRLHITEEDRARTLLYQQEKERSQFTKSHVNMRDFIEGLNLVITITAIEDNQFERVAQLTQRTNQFNTTTMRRSELDLKKFLEDPLNAIYTVTVSDRFGSYGLVGVLFSSQKGEGLWVDSILLSCRVLGRGVEHRMIAFLGEKAEDANLKQIEIPYKKTKRNEPVKNFLIHILEDRQAKDEEEITFQISTEKARHTTYEPNAESPLEIKEDVKEKSKIEAGDSADLVARGYYALAANYSQPKALLHEIEPIHEDIAKKLKESSDKENTIKEFLMGSVAEITLHTQDDLLNTSNSTTLLNLGIDSLQIIELDRKIRRLNLIKKPSFIEMQHQTIDQLTKFILDNLDVENAVIPLESNDMRPLSTAPEFLSQQNWAYLPDAMQIFWYFDMIKMAEQTMLALDLYEDVDIEFLEVAYNLVLKKHPIFFIETRYLLPKYKVAPFHEQKLPFLDLTTKPTKKNILLEILYNNFITRFGVKEVPKIKCLLARMDEKHFVFSIVTPHYILDGRAAFEFIKQVENVYRSLKKDLPLPSFPRDSNYLFMVKKFDEFIYQQIDSNQKLIKKHDAKGYKGFNTKGLSYLVEASPIKRSLSKKLRENFRNSCLQNSRSVAFSISALFILSLEIVLKKPLNSFQMMMNRVIDSEFARMVGPLATFIYVTSETTRADSIENYLKKTNDLIEELEKITTLPLVYFLPIQNTNIFSRMLSRILKPYFSLSNPLTALRYASLLLDFIRELISMPFNPHVAFIWLQIFDSPPLGDFSVNFDIFSQIRAKFIPKNNIYFMSTEVDKEWAIYLISRLEPVMAEKCLEVFEELINLSITNPSMTISEILKKNNLDVFQLKETPQV